MRSGSASRLAEPGTHRARDRLRPDAGRFAGWLQNRAERLDLARLDARTLGDLGLSRGDVERELDRPFWEPVDHAALEAARRRSGPRLGA